MAKSGRWLALAGLFMVGVEGYAQVRELRPDLNLRLYASSPCIADINGDGYNDIIVVAGYYNGYVDRNLVFAFSGAGNYTVLPGWPRQIGSWFWQQSSSVAVGDINFDGRADVLVGGNLSAERTVFAFRGNATDVPGWERVASEYPLFINSALCADANLDGAPDLLMVDESTYLHRFGALARLWHCQWVSDPVVSSPALGDVGALGAAEADGIPDTVSCGSGTLTSSGRGVCVFDTFGVTDDAYGIEDLLFNGGPSYPRDWYWASPALVDLDQDGTLDIVVARWSGEYDGQLIVLPNANFGEFCEFTLPNTESLYPEVFWFGYSAMQFSSPSVVDLDGDGLAREIVIGSDGGRLYAVRYDPTAPLAERIKDDLPGWVGGVVVDGSPVTTSPVVADLVGGDEPEIVVGTDLGHVYILDVSGNVLANYGLGTTGNAADDAIVGTPAVGVRRTGERPFIVAGNRNGVYLITLSSYPVYDPAGAQWPTFRRDSARTGRVGGPAGVPTHGSIGGQVPECEAGVQVWLYGVPDPQTGEPYVVTSAADGRFVFEMLPPGTYTMLIESDPALAATVAVNAGAMSRVYPPAGTDCNGNGVPDKCDVDNGTSPDCNGNGIPDSCDIASGFSDDCNQNRVPDECEGLDITSQGTIIAWVIDAGGSEGCGNSDPKVIRDGLYLAVGTEEPSDQYDSYRYDQHATVDWIGYQFRMSQRFASMTFQEGMHNACSRNGGWFESLNVEVLVGGVWQPVSGLQVSPPYSGDNGVDFETFTLSFTPISGTAIRISGPPGGADEYISVGELRVRNLPPCVATDPQPV